MRNAMWESIRQPSTCQVLHAVPFNYTLTLRQERKGLLSRTLHASELQQSKAVQLHEAAPQHSTSYQLRNMYHHHDDAVGMYLECYVLISFAGDKEGEEEEGLGPCSKCSCSQGCVVCSHYM